MGLAEEVGGSSEPERRHLVLSPVPLAGAWSCPPAPGCGVSGPVEPGSVCGVSVTWQLLSWDLAVPCWVEHHLPNTTLCSSKRLILPLVWGQGERWADHPPTRPSPLGGWGLQPAGIHWLKGGAVGQSPSVARLAWA